MNKKREFDIFFKDGDAYASVYVKTQNQNVDVKIRDFDRGDFLSAYAKRGLKGIQSITESQKEQIMDDFWRFAQNCMSVSNYEGDNCILEEGETQLERSKKMLNIYDKIEAFSRCKIIYSHTFEVEHGVTDDQGNSYYDLWFECPWDGHYSLVEFTNGKLSGYSFC